MDVPAESLPPVVREPVEPEPVVPFFFVVVVPASGDGLVAAVGNQPVQTGAWRTCPQAR